MRAIRPPQSLRIAFIGGRGIGSAYSGIETYYEEVGARLVSFGHQVFAYCRRHATPAGIDFRGVQPIFQPCVRSKHGETLTHTLAATADVMRRPMDLVQYHALGPSLFSALPRLRGARTVASIRGLDWQREKWGLVARGALQACERLSHRLPNGISVVSRTLQAHYRSRYGARVTWIPNGVTLEASPPPREIRALGLAGRDYFLFMGRLSPEKNVEVLIDAWRSLAGRARLVVCGGSSYTDAYMEALRRDAPPGLLFPGRVDGRLRAELYAHAAAFVLPSTMEGLSVALLEAMGHGATVITTDIPENRELVQGVGRMFPVGDTVELAAALRDALDHPEQARRLGDMAQQRVRTGYTWDQVARRTEAFFYEVLDRRAPQPLPARPPVEGKLASFYEEAR
ncbi:MAG: glycosyltransferase family 4 protein [Deltaproteobacteria bacterium]|nr:glycosyltransferase family 4 protein [Deltaproteobacteria bacterium]